MGWALLKQELGGKAWAGPAPVGRKPRRAEGGANTLIADRAGFEPRRGGGFGHDWVTIHTLGSGRFFRRGEFTERLKSGADRPQEVAARSARRDSRPTSSSPFTLCLNKRSTTSRTYCSSLKPRVAVSGNVTRDRKCSANVAKSCTRGPASSLSRRRTASRAIWASAGSTDCRRRAAKWGWARSEL